MSILAFLCPVYLDFDTGCHLLKPFVDGPDHYAYCGKYDYARPKDCENRLRFAIQRIFWFAVVVPDFDAKNHQESAD
jgi:hypothetical protein